MAPGVVLRNGSSCMIRRIVIATYLILAGLVLLFLEKVVEIMTSDKYLLIGRGKNGWHAAGLSKWGEFSSSGGSLEDYLSRAEDGTNIYDCSEADYASFASIVFSGPMVKPSLPAGTIQKFGDMQAMAKMLPALDGDFKSIAKFALAGLSSLDYIATDVFFALLKEKVPGAKVGTVQQGKIVWNA
jgi:hypothetical protein